MRKKILLTTNIVLFLLVIVLVFLNFYREKVHFNCEFGAVPQDVLKTIKKEFPSVDTEGILVVFS